MVENVLHEAVVQIDEQQFPLTITFEQDTPIQTLIEWYRNNTAYIEKKLLEKGAILLQGAAIHSVPEFEAVTGAIGTKFRNYVDGSYPRRNLKGHVYISTEYDPAFVITLHNELSYSVKWPSRLFFGSIIPAATGGETPLADSRQIITAMDPSILEEFESKQVRYVRNLHAGEGLGPTWMDTFETDDRKVVERHCDEIAIEYHWKDNGGLKLVHTRPATRRHPVTGERVWFNQADQFHPSHFKKDVYETLMLLADFNEEELPLYACFGDGTKISEEMISTVIATINGIAISRPWVKGDFVVVDNMLVAHGRKSYTGERQTVVSMAP
jgi:hypothetical protein